jgi:hypothetical protein
MWKLILLLLITACTTPTSTVPSSNAVIKASLNFKVDGVVQYGTALVEKKKNYVIEIPMALLSPEKPLKLFFSTCHRSFEVAGLQSKDVWKYDYYPVVGLEDTGSCLVIMSVIAESSITNIGVIDFNNDGTLPLVAWCNGNLFIKTGVVFCQARESLMQSVRFNEPVRIASSGNCKAMEATKTPNMYEYQSVAGLCVYVFKSESGKYGRLTIRSYNRNKDE